MAARLPQPIAIGDHPPDEWWDIVWTAWCASKSGSIETAVELYERADTLPDGRLNASLSVLRHNIGEGSGSVSPVPPTENEVVSLLLPWKRLCSTGKYTLGDISPENMEIMTRCDAGHHPKNIAVPRRHVMVMSTGRCGTVSLYRLFKNSNLEPYHSYWFMQHPLSRWEMLCRMAAANFDDLWACSEWAETRAAEWLGEKPMIALNHTDTAYAPVFAAIHPEARFVYLRRNPEKVLESFVSKGQWNGGNNHFRPIVYDFSNDFRIDIPEISPEDGAKYHIQATESFCRAFGRVMGDRWLEISSDRLFAQDRDEIAKLLEFTGSDIDIDVAVEHFSRKINEKAHRAA